MNPDTPLDSVSLGEAWPDHEWEAVDVESDPGDDVGIVTFRCTRCGYGWRTYTTLNMPQDYPEDSCVEA